MQEALYSRIHRDGILNNITYTILYVWLVFQLLRVSSVLRSMVCVCTARVLEEEEEEKKIVAKKKKKSMSRSIGSRHRKYKESHCGNREAAVKDYCGRGKYITNGQRTAKVNTHTHCGQKSNEKYGISECKQSLGKLDNYMNTFLVF